MTSSSDSEITMTDLPNLSSNETTLTMAWKAPKDSVLRINGTPTHKAEWVRVTDSVGNGPYQVTVVRLHAPQRWSVRLLNAARALARFWKRKVWWPVADFLEDAWAWLKAN